MEAKAQADELILKSLLLELLISPHTLLKHSKAFITSNPRDWRRGELLMTIIIGQDEAKAQALEHVFFPESLLYVHCGKRGEHMT